MEVDGKSGQATEYVADPAGRLISSLGLPNAQTQASDTRYFQYDGLGNVVGRTNQQGQAVTNYSYDAFGNLLSQKGQDSNPYTYMGQAYDSATGLYYFNARWYDPQAGRFVTADPLPGNPFQSGSTNRYAYALNNPITYQDVSGLSARQAQQDPWPNWEGIWGWIVGVITAIGTLIAALFGPLESGTTAWAIITGALSMVETLADLAVAIALVIEAIPLWLAVVIIIAVIALIICLVWLVIDLMPPSSPAPGPTPTPTPTPSLTPTPSSTPTPSLTPTPTPSPTSSLTPVLTP